MLYYYCCGCIRVLQPRQQHYLIHIVFTFADLRSMHLYRIVARRDEADGSAVIPQKMEVRHECYFNEAVVRGGCSFWTSDEKMEP